MNPKDAFGCLHDTRLLAGRTEHDDDGDDHDDDGDDHDDDGDDHNDDIDDHDDDGDDHDYVQPVLHIGAYEDDDTAMVNGG